MTSKTNKKPFVLVVLDGWGIGPKDESNAIAQAQTPHFDAWYAQYAHTKLQAYSRYVGLPEEQDGNSEAGHMNIGAGRIVEQDSVMISKAISDGTFFKNPAFLQAAKHARQNNSNVHLMGLLSNGQSAHSHPDHLIALITYFSYQPGIKNLYIHLFTDGRDSHPYAAIKLIRKFRWIFHSKCTVATVIGRAYAMDRKKDWEHTRVAYEAMVNGTAGKYASSVEDAVEQAYNRGETDEFIQPTVITSNGKPVGTIRDNDAVVFFNLRSDRARQLCKPFVQVKFEQENAGAFKRARVLKNLCYIAMTDFGPDLDSVLTAFPNRDIPDTLPVALHAQKQLYVAESEKYAHMTYFFNGGYDAPVAGEERVNIPSPHVLSYVHNPKMSLPATTKKVLAAVHKGTYDFIALNISNADMIGHTGDLKATVKAVECVDEYVGKIVDAVLERDGTVIVTADHGNAEEMIDRDNGEIDTEHSKNPVPFILIRKGTQPKLASSGILADVAPTILELLGIPQPKLMTGTSLLRK